MPDNVVAVVAIAFIFGLPVSAWLITRVLTHLERMEMIKQGQIPPPMTSGGWAQAARPARPMRAAAWDSGAAEDSLRTGIKVTMVGLALLIGLSFIGYHANAGPFGMPTIEPGPWLLGGLIPTFIGLSQILVALIAGARLAPVRRGEPDAVRPDDAGFVPPGARPMPPFEGTLPPPRPPDTR